MQYDPDSMKIKLCKACKGLGKVDGVSCAECGGTGRFVEESEVNDYILGAHPFDEETMKVKLCKACKGLGEVDGAPCGECNGHGRFVEQTITNQISFSDLD